MLLRVRLSVPDRPGALGGVTRTLGAAGADILQVTVLERAGGRAVDEFTISAANPSVRERVVAGLAAAPGVQVWGIWATSVQPGAFPDLGILAQIARHPSRGLATLVDAAPALLSARWAAVVAVDGNPRLLVRGCDVPAEVMAPDLAPLRARTLTLDDGMHLVVTPLEGTQAAVVVARTHAPAFHAIELTRLTLLVDIVAAIVGRDGLTSLVGGQGLAAEGG